MLALFNSIMLKVVAGIGILSILSVLSGVLCNIWDVGENYSDFAFKIGMTGLAIMGFIALIMVGINLCNM
jgi:hypothetical protein